MSQQLTQWSHQYVEWASKSMRLDSTTHEHWLLIQDDHKKRVKQLKVAFDKNNELEKRINQL